MLDISSASLMDIITLNLFYQDAPPGTAETGVTVPQTAASEAPPSAGLAPPPDASLPPTAASQQPEEGMEKGKPGSSNSHLE